jgi:hypothetical protein
VLYQQKVLNQLSFVEEHMSKALRMAKVDDLGTCLGFSSQVTSVNVPYIYLLTKIDPVTLIFRGIKFINQSDNDACTEIYLDTDGTIKETRNGGDPVALTSSDVQINFLKFASTNGVFHSTGETDAGFVRYPFGISATNDQPLITVILEAQMKGFGYTSDGVLKEPKLLIQTSVSQRNLNYSND